MPTYRVSELQGEWLDAAAALAGVGAASPSTNANVAWSLMRLHRIDVLHRPSGDVQASIAEGQVFVEGPDEIVAILRAFVMHRLGEEVEL